MTTTKTATLHRNPSSAETAAAAPPPKLFIATPCYGNMLYMQHVYGLLMLVRSLDASGIKHVWHPLGNESLITRARNRCVADFLKTDCTDLLFIDADVGFKPAHVAAMMRSPFPIVCGAYPMKRTNWDAVTAAVKRGIPPHLLEEASGLYAVELPYEARNTRRCEVVEHMNASFVEVQDAATGFLLIRRRVIEQFIQTYGEQIKYMADDPEHYGETHYAVFQDTRDPSALELGEPPRWLSEDYWFSRMCQRMGLKIHLCLDAQLTHSGSHTWRGDVRTVIEVKDEAPANEAELPVEMVDPDADEKKKAG